MTGAEQARWGVVGYTVRGMMELFWGPGRPYKCLRSLLCLRREPTGGRGQINEKVFRQ